MFYFDRFSAKVYARGSFPEKTLQNGDLIQSKALEISRCAYGYKVIAVRYIPTMRKNNIASYRATMKAKRAKKTLSSRHTLRMVEIFIIYW